MAAAWRNETGLADSSGSGTIAVTMDTAVLAGSLLWATVGCDSGHTVSGVADSVNGAWAIAGVTRANGDAQRTEIWYKANSGAGTPVVTATFDSSTSFRALSVNEVTGIQTSPDPLDKTASATGSSSTPSSGSVTPTTDGQYLAGLLYRSGTTVSVPGSWTTRNATTTDAEPFDRVQGAAASVAFAVTLAGNNTWSAHIATFKADAGGAAATRGTPFGHRGTAFNGGRTFNGIINREAAWQARLNSSRSGKTITFGRGLELYSCLKRELSTQRAPQSRIILPARYLPASSLRTPV